MSYWADAITEPNASVVAPKIIKKQFTVVVNSKMVLNLMIKNTPAITSVEEWIRADAGVGASIASGNQT